MMNTGRQKKDHKKNQEESVGFSWSAERDSSGTDRLARTRNEL